MADKFFFFKSQRFSLQTDHLSTFVTNRILGPSLSKYHPVEYVGTWLWNGRRFAEETDRRKWEELDPLMIFWDQCGTEYEY
jgi:hypothetical protein